MPLVRISLSKRHTQETQKGISLAVHQSLANVFGIPNDDYFQIIEELELHQLKFPENYLDISHTADIVYIHIIAGQGRTVEIKRQLYAEIADRIVNSTPITKNNIIILLQEINVKENMSFGNGEIQELKHLTSHRNHSSFF